MAPVHHSRLKVAVHILEEGRDIDRDGVSCDPSSAVQAAGRAPEVSSLNGDVGDTIAWW